MKSKKPKYRVISDFHLLSSNIPLPLKKASEKFPVGNGHFRAVLEGQHVISFILYAKHNNECVINYLWLDNKPRIKFAKEYGTTPAQYLIEALIREGVRVFDVEKLTKFGRKAKERVVHKRREFYVVRKGYSPKRETINQAKSRKTLPELVERQRKILIIKKHKRPLRAPKRKLPI